MPNPIKYNTSTESNALNSGNFWIGTGDVSKGPTSQTGYWNGITPPAGGYTIYVNKASQGPSIRVAANSAELIIITNMIAGTSYTTEAQCLAYYAGETDKMCVNRDYEGIVTDGLILNLDAGFVPSYPQSGTTWYDVGGVINGTLTNGPTFNSGDGGSIVFDGVDDYISVQSSLDSLNGTTEASLVMWVKLNSGRNSSGLSGIIQLSGFNNGNGNLYFYTDSARVGGIWLDIFRTNRVFTGDWTPTFNATNWHMLTVTTTPGTNGWKMYLNNVLRYQTTGQNTVSVNSSIQGGLNIGRNSRFRELRGNISITMIYNRALTSSEVLQNYNAQKDRFGL